MPCPARPRAGTAAAAAGAPTPSPRGAARDPSMEEGGQAMDERELREWIAGVQDRALSRRDFARMLAGFGLAAPVAAQLLAATGPRRASAQTKPAFTPARRGGGGELK